MSNLADHYEATLERVAVDPSLGPSPPPCGTCGGAQWVLARRDIPPDHPDFARLLLCPSCGGAIKQKEIDRLIGLSGLGRHRHIRLEEMRPRREQFSAWDTIALYATQPDGWLYLHGPNGSGKTHLAYAIGNARIDQGDSVLFRVTLELLDDLRRTMHRKDDDDDAYTRLIDLIGNCDLLILDDFGRENPTDWVNERLFQIIDRRWRDRSPTVLTSNKSTDELDRAIASRIQDSTVCQMFYVGPRNER